MRSYWEGTSLRLFLPRAPIAGFFLQRGRGVTTRGGTVLRTFRIRNLILKISENLWKSLKTSQNFPRPLPLCPLPLYLSTIFLPRGNDLPLSGHRAECPEGQRDISMGQTGHVHWVASVQKWGCPTEFLHVYCCKPFFSLPHSKTPRTPNLSKIYPDDCFSGFQSGDPNLQQMSKNWKTTISGKNFNFSTNFRRIWVPLIETPKNNRQDKFCTNLGFGASSNALRGKRVCKFIGFCFPSSTRSSLS